ncbi:DUF3958 family protein [Streptococcus oricebi]|uniref:Flagellar FliJ protein n=1 Tax=Streptococcus oricebi TaxID=1547447 RepID=A0ABS5B3W6_9STRE|nr:DUF3958 family protein [Streptococcus oricebi]MBP2623514.1 hypothetical protein [Streptococcus oricebi]
MTTWEELLKEERACYKQREQLEDQRRDIQNLLESYQDYDKLNRRYTNNLWENFYLLEQFYIFEEQIQQAQTLTNRVVDELFFKDAKLRKKERAIEEELEQIYKEKRNL